MDSILAYWFLTNSGWDSVLVYWVEDLKEKYGDALLPLAGGRVYYPLGLLELLDTGGYGTLANSGSRVAGVPSYYTRKASQIAPVCSGFLWILRRRPSGLGTAAEVSFVFGLVSSSRCRG